MPPMTTIERPTGIGSAHAGQCVVDRSDTLLATAVLLADDLGRRGAASALEESLAQAQHTCGGRDAVVSTTRDLVDTVLGLLPSARRDTEFSMGVTG